MMAYLWKNINTATDSRLFITTYNAYHMLHPSTLQFFRELRKNNSKAWFDQNRGRYEEAKKDYHRLTASLLERMQAVEPDLAHLQVRDCIFRINRDIRFSNNKEPYKTHIGIILTPHGKKLEYAAYYVHLDEDEGSFAGGGMYRPDPEITRKIRKEISNFFEDFTGILNDSSFISTYEDLDREEGSILSRPPKGYDENDPAIEYLKFKSFTATRELRPALLSDPQGVDKLVAILKDLKPFIDFLNRALRDH